MATLERTSEVVKAVRERRVRILERTKALAAEVQPLEFESYRDYFILHTFKRGRSESGKVDSSRLKRMKSGVYYERIGEIEHHENQTVSGESQRGSSAEDADYVARGTRRQTQMRLGTPTTGANTDVESAIASGGKEDLRAQAISADISVESIIPNGNADNNVRRSMRLTSKEKERLKKVAAGTSSTQEELEVVKAADIASLYEVIIPKDRSPVRRSDWVLPPRQRYIPIKHVPVKHVPEQVKINELVKNPRIKTVLSRFEGGLAGVRTSKTP